LIDVIETAQKTEDDLNAQLADLGKDNLEMIDEIARLKKHVAMLQGEVTSLNKEKHRLNGLLDAANGAAGKKGDYVTELE